MKYIALVAVLFLPLELVADVKAIPKPPFSAEEALKIAHKEFQNNFTVWFENGKLSYGAKPSDYLPLGIRYMEFKDEYCWGFYFAVPSDSNSGANFYIRRDKSVLFDGVSE